MQIRHISSFKKGRQVFTLLHYVEKDFYELAKINASIGRFAGANRAIRRRERL